MSDVCGTPNRRDEKRRTWRWGRGLAFGLLGVVLLWGLSGGAHAASAQSSGGDHGKWCSDGNLTHVWCGGDFTTCPSSGTCGNPYADSWDTNPVNTQPASGCTYGNGVIASYSAPSTSSGVITAKSSAQVQGSNACGSYNVGEMKLDLGFHGASFTANFHGSPGGYGTYTFTVYFTMNDYVSAGDYSGGSCQDSESSYVLTSTAAWDNTAGSSVGYSTNGYENQYSSPCNGGSSSTDTGQTKTASFQASIYYGDTIVPRGHIVSDVYVSIPVPNSHGYATNDYSGGTYGDITMTSIVVS